MVTLGDVNFFLKSEESYDSAEMLYKVENYCSCVNRYYYSCIMAAKNYILRTNNWTVKNYDREYDRAKRKYSRNDVPKEKRGSHNYLINLLQTKLATSADIEMIEKALLITEKISDLKTERVKADYKEIAISFSEARDCRESAKQVLDFLKQELK